MCAQDEARRMTLGGGVCLRPSDRPPRVPTAQPARPGSCGFRAQMAAVGLAPPPPPPPLLRGSPLWGHLPSRAGSPGPLTTALTSVPRLPPTQAAPSAALPARSPGPRGGLRASASLTAVSRPAGRWCSCPTGPASTAAATRSWRRCWWGWACWSSPTTTVSTGPLRAPRPPRPTLLPPRASRSASRPDTGGRRSPWAASK